MELDKRRLAMEGKRVYWRGVVQEAEQCGLSSLRFCKARGISEDLFYYWRRLLKRESASSSGAGAKPEGRFVLVSSETIAPQSPTSVMELVVERGWRLRIPAGADAATLRMVLGELAREQ